MWSAFLVFKARMGVSSGVYSQLCHSSSVTISHFTEVPDSSGLQWGIGLMINWTTLHNSICMTLKMLQKHFISGSAKGREYFKAIFMENRGVGIKWIFTMLRAAVILYDWTSLSNVTCNECETTIPLYTQFCHTKPNQLCALQGEHYIIKHKLVLKYRFLWTITDHCSYST